MIELLLYLRHFMTSPKEQPRDSRHAPGRSWSWVSHKTFSATPFYRKAWQILKQDWLVFVWKLLADVAARATMLGIGLLLMSLVIIDFQFFLTAGHSPLGWPDHLLSIFRSPLFIAGAVGALFFGALLATAAQALIIGGIWGLLDVGLRGDTVQRWSTFWQHALRRFPDVLALYLLRFAAGVVTSFLGAALVLITYDAASSGALSAAPQGWVVFAFAGSLTCLLAWSGLTRLALEVIGAPLVIDDVDLGEAILRGCAFVIDHFWSLYRLLIFALAVLLVPLGIYWVLIMVNNLTLFVPELATFGSILQLLGQLLLTVSITVIGIFFYGALFAFYHRDDEAVAIEQERRDRELASTTGPFRRDASLQDFLPHESPHRFDIDAVLPSDSTPSPSAAGDPRDGDEDSRPSDAPEEDKNGDGEEEISKGDDTSK